MKKNPVAKDIKVETRHAYNAVKPTKSFPSKELWKSLLLYPDVAIERNMTTATSEVQKETNDEPAKSLDGFSCLFPSLARSSTVVDMVKVTVTKIPATTMPIFDMLVSHSPPFITRSLWLSVKISSGVLPSLLER
ncbi:hypothetical protein ACJW30_10G175400 [Castanea mollissima]